MVGFCCFLLGIFLYECLWLPSKVCLNKKKNVRKKNLWNINALAKWLYDGFEMIMKYIFETLLVFKDCKKTTDNSHTPETRNFY